MCDRVKKIFSQIRIADAHHGHAWYFTQDAGSVTKATMKLTVKANYKKFSIYITIFFTDVRWWRSFIHMMQVEKKGKKNHWAQCSQCSSAVSVAPLQQPACCFCFWSCIVILSHVTRSLWPQRYKSSVSQLLSLECAHCVEPARWVPTKRPSISLQRLKGK